jgi:hypothetical protein
MSEVNAKEEMRLQRALSRVKTPQRSVSAPSVKAPVTSGALSQGRKEPLTFLELRVARQAETSLQQQKAETSLPPLIPPRQAVAVPVNRLAAPRTAQVVVKEERGPGVLSDSELEKRCLKWLEQVTPLLYEEEPEFMSFEVGEDLKRSPRVVK